jgi:hypothetical protein
MKYLIAKTVRPKGVCALDSIENVPEREDLRFGISYIKRWPEDARFSMDAEYPKDIALADSLDNVSMLLVASQKFKEALEGIPGALHSNEVLPVKIINHKGRAEKAPYYIIHQVDHPPLDEAKSEGTRARLNPKRFQFLKKMVLDDSKIDKKLMLFRVAQYSMLPLVREDLADKLTALKLSGLEFHEIKGFAFGP